jgi:hypothetical protein
MPCYRCAKRQSDPGKGPSDWKRGVLDGVQVLICPGCQGSHDWQAELDCCEACGSVRLVRALGETRCKECGNTLSAAGGSASVDESLADDVSAALKRRFGPYPD